MHRFFVPVEWIEDGRARLGQQVARQISRVLRMSAGEQVVLLDNSGREYVTRLERITHTMVEGEVTSVLRGSGKPRLDVTLYQALLKGDRFEWVLQKGTELGVSTFVPMSTERTVLRSKEYPKKLSGGRWESIIREAAEQSRCSILPEIHHAVDFKEACQAIEGKGLSLMPWERERSRSLRSILLGENVDKVNIFIGPEGGLGDQEVEYALSCGILTVSLGQRILRAETAAIASIVAGMYASGGLGC